MRGEMKSATGGKPQSRRRRKAALRQEMADADSRQNKLTAPDGEIAADIRTRYEEIANCLSDDPPEWLADYLHAQGAHIAFVHEAGKSEATRAELLGQLEALQQAVELVRRYVGADQSGTIDEVALRSLLDPTPTPPFSVAHRDTDKALRDLNKRVEEARRSPLLVGPDGEVIKGRGKANVVGGMSAEMVCACVIAAAFEVVNGKRPGARNPSACDAAEAYWRAIGLERVERGEDKRTAWRRYFETATSASHEFYIRAYREAIERWAAQTEGDDRSVNAD